VGGQRAAVTNIYCSGLRSHLTDGLHSNTFIDHGNSG